jgi:ATPase subunit of ABC transporter with duplicated ATPase domains
MSPKARQAKGKARLNAYDQLRTEEIKEKEATLELFIPPGPRLGDVVIETEHLGKGFGDRLLIDDLTFKVPKNAVVGIIGPNGVGKSTLFRMIMGTENQIAEQSPLAIQFKSVMSTRLIKISILKKQFTMWWVMEMKSSQ